MGKIYGKTTGWVATTEGPVRVRLNPWGQVRNGEAFMSVYLYSGNRSESVWIPAGTAKATRKDCETTVNSIKWESLRKDA